MAYTNLIWAAATDLTISSDNYTLTGVGTNWTSKAMSNTTLDTGDKLRITYNSSSGMLFAGIGIDPYPGTPQQASIEYATSANGSGGFDIYESGTWKTNSVNTDTIWYIEITATDIIYKQGTTTIRTVPRASGTLYAHIVIKSTESVNIAYETTSSGGGSGGGGGEDPPIQYTDGDSNAHAHLKPLHIFRRQRDWF